MNRPHNAARSATIRPMKRRAFLTAAAATGASACRLVSSPADFELDDVSLADIASGLRQGKWTCSRLTDLYLARIDAVDRNGPRLGAVVELNPDARALARQLDRERTENRVRGPLQVFRFSLRTISKPAMP